jgi:hypothetical protein
VSEMLLGIQPYGISATQVPLPIVLPASLEDWPAYKVSALEKRDLFQATAVGQLLDDAGYDLDLLLEAGESLQNIDTSAEASTSGRVFKPRPLCQLLHRPSRRASFSFLRRSLHVLHAVSRIAYLIFHPYRGR